MEIRINFSLAKLYIAPEDPHKCSETHWQHGLGRPQLAARKTYFGALVFKILTRSSTIPKVKFLPRG